MNSKLILSLLPLTFIGMVGMAGVLWLELHSTDNSIAHVGRLENKISLQSERLNAINLLILELGAEFKQLQTKDRAISANGEIRASHVNDAIASAQESADAGLPVESSLEDAQTANQVAIPVEDTFAEHPLAAEYDSQWTQSEWGKNAANDMEESFAEHTFFKRFGGSLVTDCRESTCRAEWLLPDLDGLSQAERDDLLSTARYEMLALAADNATEVGELAVDWRSGADGQSIATIFRKTEALR